MNQGNLQGHSSVVSDMSRDNEIIYVGDPMCSWCWGIAPELDEVVTNRSDIAFRVVVGGLHPGGPRVDDRLAAMLAHHWHQVEDRSGQPFDHTLLERRDWEYDTEPACRAVVTVRSIAPELTLKYFQGVQRAFYAEGQVPTEGGVLAEVASQVGIASTDFLDRFETAEVRDETEADFSMARSWGVTGFPTVVARSGNKLRAIARGYTTAEVMLQNLEAVMGPVDLCAPGEIC